jgi:hypothetical protein
MHGASHQAVMEFQVVTNRQMRDARAGRSKIAFYFRKDMPAIASGIEERKTDTSKMKISSAELTLLDLLRYPQASAGLDNISTVFPDLGPKVDIEGLSALCHAFERSVVQRAGYLLDASGFARHAEKLHALIERRSQFPWVELDSPGTVGDWVRLFPGMADRAYRGVEDDCDYGFGADRVWGFDGGGGDIWDLSGYEGFAD